MIRNVIASLTARRRRRNKLVNENTQLRARIADIEATIRAVMRHREASAEMLAQFEALPELLPDHIKNKLIVQDVRIEELSKSNKRMEQSIGAHDRWLRGRKEKLEQDLKMVVQEAIDRIGRENVSPSIRNLENALRQQNKEVREAHTALRENAIPTEDGDPLTPLDQKLIEMSLDAEFSRRLEAHINMLRWYIENHHKPENACVDIVLQFGA